MTQRGLSVSAKGDAVSRLSDSDIARAFSGTPVGTRTRGPKPGSNTEDAFKKLSDIASKNDVILNNAIGCALVKSGLATEYETEKDLNTGLTRYTDIVCQTPTLGVVRLEIMWRGTASRAAIANYVLTKLHNYGRAIGFLTGKSG